MMPQPWTEAARAETDDRLLKNLRLRTPAYQWRLVGILAVTQALGYGLLYYTFAAFLAPTARALHTSTTTVTGALTASLLAGAAAAFPVGRWLDRHGGRALMATGSLLATVLALAWSRVHDVAELYAVWIVLGVACSAVLYEAAFAVIVSWFAPEDRLRATLAVTMIAGFTGIIFLPLAGALARAYGWREAVALLAAGYGCVAVPLHLFIRRPPHLAACPIPPVHPPGGGPARAERIRAAVRERVFWVLAGSFVAETGALTAISVLLVTMLHSLGHGQAFAATAAGLVGILSIAGQLTAATAGRRWPAGYVTAAAFACQAVGAVLLPLAGHSGPGAIGCVAALGLGFGVSIITRPAILSDRYGTADYATLAAAWHVPTYLVRAFAPLGAALLWHAAGLASTLDAAAGCYLLGAFGLVLSVGYRRDKPLPG
jgi:predicted MFS family arabinose efflux permease